MHAAPQKNVVLGKNSVKLRWEREDEWGNSAYVVVRNMGAVGHWTLCSLHTAIRETKHRREQVGRTHAINRLQIMRYDAMWCIKVCV